MIVMPNGLPASQEPKLLLPRIRKYRDRRLDLRGMRFGVEGFFRLECVYPYLGGISRWLTPMFHNHVTDVGLDMYATTTNRLAACRVGTGTTAPTDGDTTLEAFLAGTLSRSNGSDHNTGNTSSPPYWRQVHYVFTFGVGDVVGNISEISVGPSPATAGTNSFARELIRDEEGDPTTIALNSEQQLRAHYWQRHYAPEADNAGSVDITLYGVPTSHSFTRRAAFAGASGEWLPEPTTSVLLFSSNVSLYSGAIGVATSQPSGTQRTASGATNGSYSSGTFSRTCSAQWNTAAGVGVSQSIYIKQGGVSGPCAHQIGLSPSIEKDNTETLELNFTSSWGRYSP